MLKDPHQNVLIRLWMIGQVIDRHFDSAYEIPMNKMLMDPVYWKKVKGRIGLPESSYIHDIIKVIKKYEEEVYG